MRRNFTIDVSEVSINGTSSIGLERVAVHSDKQGIGRRLRELRLQHKYSVQRVAASIGRHGSNYRRYESKGVLPDFETLKKLVHMYGVTADDLLRDYISTVEDVIFEPQEHKRRYTWTKTMREHDKEKEIRHRLIELRRQHDYTQEDVAKRIGVARSQYAKCEVGIIEPSYPMLVRLMRMYGVSADFLLMGDRAESDKLPPSLRNTDKTETS